MLQIKFSMHLEIYDHANQKVEQRIKLNMVSKRKESVADLELATASMRRLCKKAGAHRVSEAAAFELARVLEEIGLKIGKEALDFSIHAGRKTLKAVDMEIAKRKVVGK